MKVNEITINNTTTKIKNRPTTITVKKDGNLTIIAKRFGMSKTEFIKWCNIKGSVKVGQKITLPTAKISKGKGIYALAREYNMTISEFCKINDIKDPQNYKAREGELFYVKTHQKQIASNNKKQKQTNSSTLSTAKSGSTSNTTVHPPQNNIKAGKTTASSTYLNSDNRKIITKPKNSPPKTFTVSSLRNDAIKSAKIEAFNKFKLFCEANGIEYDPSKLDISALDRIPAPTRQGTSIVTANSGQLPPTAKPNGKVVIVNAGHGGYSSRSGYYDPGSYSFIKKGNGKYAPLIEADIMKKYGDSIVDKLRRQGYSVILTSGHIETISDQNSLSNIVRDLKSNNHGKRYSDRDILFISLHADSDPSKKGSGICFDSNFDNNKRLAQIMQTNLNEAPWINANLSERNWLDSNGTINSRRLQVLHQTESIPSVLLEVEYVNGSRSQNLDSGAYQKQFEDKVIEAINEYFRIKR